MEAPLTTKHAQRGKHAHRSFARDGDGANTMIVPPTRSAFARLMYVSIPTKFMLALLAAIAWMGFSIWLSLPWLDDLELLIGKVLALFLISFIAYIPGFMNAFLVASLLLDRRPPRGKPANAPGVTVLVPCYNESAAVADTIHSLSRQKYSGDVEFLILDDGSTDNTLTLAREAVAALPPERRALFKVIAAERNAGKAAPAPAAPAEKQG